MKNTLILLGLFILTFIAGWLFFSSSSITGQVVSPNADSVSVENNQLSIVLNEEANVPGDSVILISVIDGDEVIAIRTMDFRDFAQSNAEVFSGPKVFTRSIEELLNATVNENYELFVDMPAINIRQNFEL